MKKESKEMRGAIKQLLRRRQQHQRKIDKLLGIKQQPSKTDNSLADLSIVLKNLQGQDRQQNLTTIGNHVNLLATVTLKTQYHLQEPNRLEQGRLYASLKQLYKFEKTSTQLKNQPNVPQWLKKIGVYLVENDYNELFSMQKQEFIATHFSLGKYSQIQLSLQELKEQQKQYIHYDQPNKLLYIGYLLLKRLINSPEALIPQVLHKIFAFPIKRFNIHQTTQFLSMLQEHFKNDMQSPQFKVFGIYQSNQFQQLKLPSKRSLKSYPILLHKYKQIIMIQQEDLQVKQLPLSCLSNHFVVLTLIVRTPGSYYLNLGSSNSSRQYRMCLLSEQYSIVTWQTIKDNQFMHVSLKAQQYQLYISPMMLSVSQPTLLEQSYELVKEEQEQFMFWIQGQGVYGQHGDLQIQLRLKQEYNTYTAKIAEMYMQTVKEKQFCSKKINQNDVLVVRQKLWWMGLVVDTFRFDPKDSTNKLLIIYQQRCLCDDSFQSRQVTVKNGQSVTCYQAGNIEHISLASQPQNHLSFRITTQYY